MRIKPAHIALILSILALAVSLFTAVQVSQNDDAALIDALMAQNQQLQEQIDALANQTPEVPGLSGETGTVTDAALTAAVWPDNQGADVTMTLNTDDAPAGDVLLRVMLGNTVITEVPCTRDGDSFTATAALDAANGYIYSLIMGNEARTLASPDKPVYPELVYLADSLNAYCNLVVGDWYVGDDALTLSTCYAQVRTPILSTAGLTCTQVDLVLKNGDTVLSQVDVTDALTEESGSFDGQISNAVLPLPALTDGEQVDLWLEARLSDGQVLTACAATWYAMHDGFSMSAG